MMETKSYSNDKLHLNRFVHWAWRKAWRGCACGALGMVMVYCFMVAQASAQASVNGIPISSQRYFIHYQQLLKSHPNAEGNVKLELRLAQRALLPLVEEQLLRMAAEHDQLDLSQLKVDDPVAALRVRLPTDERLAFYLVKIGETEETLRSKHWRQDVSRLLMEKRGLLDVSDEEILKEYNRRKPTLVQPERVRGRQLLVRLPKEATPEQVNQGFQHIQSIHQAVVSGELSFDVAIQRYSEGYLRLKGGDMGLQPKGKLVTPVEDALWSLKDGEMSVPVRSQYGWHIILRVSRMPETSRSLEEMRASIEEGLRKRKYHKGKRPFIKSLWDAAEIDSEVALSY